MRDIRDRRPPHVDAGYRFIRVGDPLKCNAGSPSFTPDHTTLFLCARPDQLEPVRQDGRSTNFQTCASGGVVNDGAIDNRVSRTANDLGGLGHM